MTENAINGDPILAFLWFMAICVIAWIIMREKGNEGF